MVQYLATQAIAQHSVNTLAFLNKLGFSMARNTFARNIKQVANNARTQFTLLYKSLPSPFFFLYGDNIDLRCVQATRAPSPAHKLSACHALCLCQVRHVRVGRREGI